MRWELETGGAFAIGLWAWGVTFLLLAGANFSRLGFMCARRAERPAPAEWSLGR